MTKFIDVVTHSSVPTNSIARHTVIKGPLTYKATLLTPPGTAQFDDPLVFPAAALALPPPSGIADNLLLANVSGKDLILEFPVPRKIRDPERDNVQLVVDGNLIGSPVPFTGFVVGETFEIELPASARPEGTHSIVYRVTYYAGGGTEDGPPKRFGSI